MSSKSRDKDVSGKEVIITIDEFEGKGFRILVETGRLIGFSDVFYSSVCGRSDEEGIQI